jgi:hypothetical protein
LVSLPFSARWEPPLTEASGIEDFMSWIRESRAFRLWGYIELRPLWSTYGEYDGVQPSPSYWFHELDLEPSAGEIFRRLHKNSFQRKIERAERERLTYAQVGLSISCASFTEFLLKTRRRHQALPQPTA